VKLAILFWFYKELAICEDRLRLLRRLNPEASIYGLFGGEPSAAGEAQARLGGLLDDFYAFPDAQSPDWKWRNGDRLIAAWAEQRGRALAWDTVVVVQWDMLLLAPVQQLFGMLQPGQALFSGLRPLEEIESWWGWAGAKDPEKRQEREAFRSELARGHGYRGPLLACLFIVVCLPRRFLELYPASGPPETGFLEYKCPTMARVFDIPFCTDHPYRPWWASDPATRDAPARERVLNAVGRRVSLPTVLREVLAADGARVIHPFEDRFHPWLRHGVIARLMLGWMRLRGPAA